MYIVLRRVNKVMMTLCCCICVFSGMIFFFFFFQAEDGIRDVAVTGVQTCALPILLHMLCTTFPQPAIPPRLPTNTFFSQHCSGKSLPGRNLSQGRRAQAEENSIHFVFFLSGRLNR